MGPVLLDGGCDTLGFLVPAGTAAGWDVPGSTCTETDGCGLSVVPAVSVEGPEWLLPPGKPSRRRILWCCVRRWVRLSG
ncbi:hypothetical protein SHKM778_81670 [Streptomyces sp. KM77-8]|uniref:Uncharacterized protein n=1 Tax=Streptomyces haneummycinicus TaxID=3074435 RepID=A0AAT9HWS4_9ACTN